MRTSIATVSLSGSLPEKLTAAAAAGFDGVELFEDDLIASPLSPKEIHRRAADLGLSILLYQPFRDAEGLPEDLFTTVRRRAECKFALMEQLGVDLLLVCSNTLQQAVDDDELAAAQLHALAEQASAHGVRIAYEALAWGRQVHDYRHAWRVVESAGHPGLGLCLDSFHILARSDDPAGIAAIPGEKIFHLQLADAAPSGIQHDARQLSWHHRCVPGQGALDLTGFTTTVLGTGYRGPLSLEIFNDALRWADPERTAVDGMRSLIVLGHEVHKRLPDPVTLVELPDAAPPQGFAFVELTVDAYAEQSVKDLLARMGFIYEGLHRTKPVTLWRQGEARLVLNRAQPAVDRREHGRAGISTIGIEDPYAFRSAARAHGLMAPSTPRAIGPGEVRPPALTAPDGTGLYLCHTEADDSWLADFEPRSGACTDAGRRMFDRIDHVVLSPRTNQFEETVLFFRAAFGLRLCADEEIAEPHGLLRSRALGDGPFRLVLNVPALVDDHRHQGLQHVAFACSDIFATAAGFHANGVPTLAIPQNYYDDLAARTDLPPQTLEDMCEHGILYDGDDDGEFYHLFTAALGRLVFFEVVQRTGGYDGYGAPNAPIRRAVQSSD